MNLEESRAKIDQIDREMTALFEERLKAVTEVALYKKANGMAIHDAKREAEVIAKNCAYLKDPVLSGVLTEFYQHLMDIAKDYEKQLMEETVVVGYQGVEGAFTALAVQAFFPDAEAITKRNYETFSEVFKALDQGEITYGVLPIDNSSTGSIAENYDSLNRYNCYIVGETQIAAEQLLLGLPGARLEEISTVYSHPQGLAQTSEFLKMYPHIEQVPYLNTAMAAQFVSETGNSRLAAIASKEAAVIYGLEILCTNITNASRNFTRFIKFARKPEQSEKCDKITILFSTRHIPGALSKVLQVVAEYGANLLHLESRPVMEKPWEYIFYLDLEGNITSPQTVEMLEKIQEFTSYYKFLGNYPREVF